MGLDLEDALLVGGELDRRGAPGLELLLDVVAVHVQLVVDVTGDLQPHLAALRRRRPGAAWACTLPSLTDDGDLDDLLGRRRRGLAGLAPRRRARRRRRRGDGEPCCGSSSPEAQPAATSSRAAASRRQGATVHARQDVTGVRTHDVHVPDRLSPLDVSFLYFEEPTTPMHVGGVAVFQAPDGRLRPRPPGRADRRRASPSCRATASGSGGCPGRLANPVWVDDENFDVSYHVRRSALPRPGTDEQLRRARRPGAEPAAGPRPAAVGDVPRRGPRPTAGSRSSPRPTTRWSTASAPSTSAR